MNEIILLIGAFAGGALLGAFFFGGLWWTVRKLPNSHAPQLLLLGSFITRIGVVLPLFYLCARYGLGAALASVMGFVIMRVAFTRRFGVRDLVQVPSLASAAERSHAP